MTSDTESRPGPDPTDPRRAPEGPGAKGRRGLRLTPLTVIAAAVVLLLIISEFAVSGDFFSRGTLSSLTPLIAIMIIVGIGQAFVIGTGGIDLSVPATMTLMGIILLKASGGQNSGLGEALVLCVVACLIIGLINGLLVEGLALNALVATLAVGQLVAGASRLYRGDVLSVADVPPRLSDVSGVNLGGVSYLLIIAVVVSILGTIFLQRVVYGRRLVASSASKRAAVLAGLRAPGYRVLAYVLASLCYGFAGVLLSGETKTPDLTLGDTYLLSSVVAVVLAGAVLTGGRVSPLATLLGAVFIIVLDHDLRVAGLSSGVRLIVQGSIIVIGLSLVYVSQNLHAIGQTLQRRGPDADAPLVPNP